MRHDKIHMMHCRCDRCTPLPAPSVVEPEDIEAMRKGLVFGLFVGGVLAARQYAPTIIDWITS